MTTAGKAYFEACGRSEAARGLHPQRYSLERRNGDIPRWAWDAYNHGYASQIWKRGQVSGDPRKKKRPKSERNSKGSTGDQREV